MERLTKRREDNGLAYLAKVKDSEQAVDSPYPSTLKAILECFQRLAAYEDTGLTPEQVEELAGKETPKSAIPRISEGLTEIGNVHFGKGVTIWSCPSCGIFLTPTHEYCWKCGQHLTFKFPDEPPKEE